MGQILTVKELAKYVKLTTVTIYKYVKVGTIPAHKIGGVWRFDKDQIDELMKSAEGIKYGSSLKDTIVRK